MLDPGEMQLRFGNGDSLSAAAVGEYEIRLSRGSIILTDCVFVPGCVANIISLFVLDMKGYHVHIQNRSMYIYMIWMMFCYINVQIYMVIIFCMLLEMSMILGIINVKDLI